jgi:hypothetical protein
MDVPGADTNRRLREMHGSVGQQPGTSVAGAIVVGVAIILMLAIAGFVAFVLLTGS